MTTYHANAIILLDKIIQECYDTKNNIRGKKYESALLTVDTIAIQLKNVSAYIKMYNTVEPSTYKRKKINL